MASSTQSPSLPISVLVELAKTGNGLHRWIRLRVLWDRVANNTQRNEADLVRIGRALDSALTEAEAHARALTVFFGAHADAINQFLGSYIKGKVSHGLDERSRRRLAAIGPDYAAYGAARAGEFVSASSAERQFVQSQIAALENRQPMLALRDGDLFCAALDAYMMEEDASCISGDAFACAVGSQLAQLGVDYGC